MDARTGGKVWIAVAERLAGEIEAGVFKPGERLANERDLAERYSVHRHTLRRAVAELAARGLVAVRHGRGTFVQRAPIPYSVSSQSRFQQNIADLSRESGGRLLGAATQESPARVALRLGLTPGTAVVKLEILREADHIPLILSEHWLPADRFPDIAARFATEQSITLALEAMGLRGLKRRESKLSARMPSAEEAALLRQPPNRPVLVWESLKTDGADTPVDFGVALVASDRMQLVFGT